MTIIIDEETFDISVISIVRKADYLDKFAERTEDGVLHREIIGVYFNYQLKLGATFDRTEYARLWDVLTNPSSAFHEVTVPDEHGLTYSFQAYFASVGDELRRIKDGEVFWRNLTVDFIAQSPARTP
jgi:hypothetical protein